MIDELKNELKSIGIVVHDNVNAPVNDIGGVITQARTGLWDSGMSYKDIAEIIAKQGKNFAFYQLIEKNRTPDGHINYMIRYCSW